MSSILRALKKLENEPRHLEESQPFDSKFVPLADTEKQNSAYNIILMVIGGGIVCGLVVLTGWWLLSGKTQPPQDVPQKIVQPLSTEQKIISEISSQDFTKTSSEKVAPETEKVSRDIPLAVSESAEQPVEQRAAGLKVSASQITAQDNVAISEKKTTDETVPSPVASDSITSEQRALPAEKSIAASGYTRQPFAKVEDIEIPKLDDPDMKLQAITWSKIPEKRLTVINNRILREGDMVSGYIISAINQDDVVLDRSGVKSKLLFR
ncbi:MAG: general secretion pathway protein GspB [Deltaproteobacteria bacterium]|nr:general secretion pathway protein GspB [Deltaproteobacteria bacterium]